MWLPSRSWHINHERKYYTSTYGQKIHHRSVYGVHKVTNVLTRTPGECGYTHPELRNQQISRTLRPTPVRRGGGRISTRKNGLETNNFWSWILMGLGKTKTVLARTRSNLLRYDPLIDDFVSIRRFERRVCQWPLFRYKISKSPNLFLKANATKSLPLIGWMADDVMIGLQNLITYEVVTKQRHEKCVYRQISR
jgi:hypothetical protein